MSVCTWILHWQLNSQFDLAVSFFGANQRPLMCTFIHFSLFSPRFLWEALVYGSEKGSLPMVSRSPLSGVFTVSCFTRECCTTAFCHISTVMPDACGLNPAARLYFSGRNEWRRMTRRQRADSCTLLGWSHVWQEGERVGSYCMAVVLWVDGERKGIKD